MSKQKTNHIITSCNVGAQSVVRDGGGRGDREKERGGGGRKRRDDPTPYTNQSLPNPQTPTQATRGPQAGSSFFPPADTHHNRLPYHPPDHAPHQQGRPFPPHTLPAQAREAIKCASGCRHKLRATKRHGDGAGACSTTSTLVKNVQRLRHAASQLMELALDIQMHASPNWS